MNSSIPAAVHSVSEPGMNCLTIRSTITRGAGCNTPSWVGTRRRYGAHGRAFSHGIEGASSTNRLTRSAWSRPSSSATRPPMLLPATCARSSSSASSSATIARAKNAAS